VRYLLTVLLVQTINSSWSFKQTKFSNIKEKEAMKKKAIIGLGQSGTFLVEDIIPYLTDMESYCVNSANINDRVAKNIPFDNRFSFNQKSGFAKSPITALQFLENNTQIQQKLQKWFHQIHTTFDETILITFFTSGTGIGTLIDLLKHLKNNNNDIVQENRSLGIIVCASYSFIFQIEEFKSQFNEIRKYLSVCEFELFFTYKDSTINTEVGKALGFSNSMNSMRYIVLDTLLNNTYKDSDFSMRLEKELLEVLNRS